MFGYMEGHYEVTDSVTFKVADIEYTAELRTPKAGGPQPAYIGLYGKDSSKLALDVVHDQLFLYKSGSVANEDWDSVKRKPEQLLDNAEQFGWYEKVEHHHTGYGRDGYYVMY